REVNRFNWFLEIVDGVKIVLGAQGKPDGLPISVPPYRPRNICHNKFILLHPSPEGLDCRRIIGRKSHRNSLWRKESQDQRQTGDRAEDSDDRIAQFPER